MQAFASGRRGRAVSSRDDETDNDLLVPIRMSQLSQMSQTNWQCLQIAYCRCPFGTRAFVPMSKGPSARLAMQNQATLAHLGRHVGFDPDQSANAARPCAPSHYGSCGPSKSLSKRKCFTL